MSALFGLIAALIVVAVLFPPFLDAILELLFMVIPVGVGLVAILVLCSVFVGLEIF